MVDLSITATEVIAGGDAVTKIGIAAATITAGDVVYLDSSGDVAVADRATSATTAAAKGIALNGGATGQPIKYQVAGTITLGATAAPAAGSVYVLSDDGAISPAADLASADYATVVGIGSGSNQIIMGITVGGQVP